MIAWLNCYLYTKLLFSLFLISDFEHKAALHKSRDTAYPSNPFSPLHQLTELVMDVLTLIAREYITNAKTNSIKPPTNPLTYIGA